MANGQKRSNKEPCKPKAEKPPEQRASPLSAKGATARSAAY